ncbi:hypothetical protein OQJ19_01440 [Fluoribacter gormanii]|nr:hypothetical protein [Fluoribacter gormanii]MCW8444142.1 hypothetical protein [Fluoribacter gormanii]MCW8469325.1 hypothetical protein [Fluoribacter gormanii]
MSIKMCHIAPDEEGKDSKYGTGSIDFVRHWYLTNQSSLNLLTPSRIVRV